jgi:histidinol phosphatase-like enzyme
MSPSAIDGLARLGESGLPLVLLLDPAGAGRPDLRRSALEPLVGRVATEFAIVSCPHSDGGCTCAKPGQGLIESSVADGATASGWLIGGDQASVQAGRGAGLRTVRIGPPMEDHRGVVHRADYDARDLVDAANRVLLEALSGG